MEITRSILLEYAIKLDGLLDVDSIDLDMEVYNKNNRFHPSIAISDSTKISYFTQQKIDKFFDTDQTILYQAYDPKIRENYGVMCKPGKFFRKIYPEKSDIEIKDLVKEWKFITSGFSGGGTLELIDDIKMAYHAENYIPACSGDLGNSCMRRAYCQGYLDFYDYYNVKILVLKIAGKIAGRALVWYDVRFQGDISGVHTFMDRVYVHDENDTILFTKYAEKNNWVWKEYQNHTDKDDFESIDSTGVATIIIEPTSSYDPMSIEYPYLDTLSWLDEDNRELCNEKVDDFIIELDQIDGQADIGVICRDCGERFDLSCGGIYIDDYGHVCGNCSCDWYYCDGCDNWYTEDNTIFIDDFIYCNSCITDHYTQCEECDEWIPNGDIIVCVGYTSYCSGCVLNNAFECFDCGDWVLNNESKCHENEKYCDHCYSEIKENEETEMEREEI